MNLNASFISDYIAANETALGDATVLTMPYTQQDVYNQLRGVYDFKLITYGGEDFDETQGLDLLNVIGFNTVLGLVMGPMADSNDLRYMAEALGVFVLASEEVNGYQMNPFVEDFINLVYGTFAADILNICGAVATPGEAADCAWALMRLENINQNAGIIVPSDLADSMPALQTAIEALTITTSQDFRNLADALDSIRRAGENDQPLLI